MHLDQFLETQRERLCQQNLYRTRRVLDGPHGVDVTVDGRRCINFCSNDYLGLAADPRLSAAASQAMSRLGSGSGAAALVSGYNRVHQQLEEALAEYTGCERALLFSSGWAANLGVIRALLGRESTLIADELNHASLIDGGRLSGARYRRVPHASVAGFREALAESDAPGAVAGRALPRLLVSDAVFSMDGDLAPLGELSALAQGADVPLMVDDAHGFGVLGEDGRGAVSALGTPQPAIYVATLGKAAGCAGAFVAGSEALIEFLIQRARTWVFSTAPPPALAAAGLAALKILSQEPEHRQRLHQNINYLREGARQRGLSLGGAPGIEDSSLRTPIQPLLIGEASRAMAVSARLMERGYWVAAIRPPTVPAGTSRLRITLSAAHTREQIDGLLDALVVALSEAEPA